jgi:hypothetical protein
MQQDRSHGRNVGRPTGFRVRLLRAALGVALAVVVVGLDTSMARAGDDDTANDSPWSKVMQRLGLSKPPGSESEINYTERAPLVVPPTRELPPPMASGTAPIPDWPKDTAKPGKRAKVKPGVVPATAVQSPNPPVEPKPWYNPLGWFNREEYANFGGEPVREDLTDPPSGYRIPSPDQPYGIGPDKKPGKAQATASDFNASAVTPSTPPSGSQSGK